MPNYCDYDMTVKGKAEDVREFISILQEKHPKGKYFYRIFEAETKPVKKTETGDIAREIFGYCAWSVASCMLDEPGTYYCCYGRDDPQACELRGETARLSLDVEVWSTEPAMGFMEHYHYRNGEELVNEVGEYTEHFWDEDEYPKFEDFKEAYNVPEDVTEEEVRDNDNRYIKAGL